MLEMRPDCERCGADLPADPRFLDAVTAALEALLTKGARATLAHY